MCTMLCTHVHKLKSVYVHVYTDVRLYIMTSATSFDAHRKLVQFRALSNRVEAGDAELPPRSRNSFDPRIALAGSRLLLTNDLACFVPRQVRLFQTAPRRRLFARKNVSLLGGRSHGLLFFATRRPPSSSTLSALQVHWYRDVVLFRVFLLYL